MKNTFFVTSHTPVCVFYELCDEPDQDKELSRSSPDNSGDSQQQFEEEEEEEDGKNDIHILHYLNSKPFFDIW